MEEPEAKEQYKDSKEVMEQSQFKQELHNKNCSHGVQQQNYESQKQSLEGTLLNGK